MASADKPYVDLHVHTWHSDSTLSPAEIVEAASLNGVGLLAIADHEVYSGYYEAKPLCESKGIRLIPACEMQARFSGILFHILCYNADMKSDPLNSMIKNNRRILDDMSVWLIERMVKDYPRLSLEEYDSYKYDRSRGGWKCLGYLMQKGITNALKEGFSLYNTYGVSYDEAGFPTLEETLKAIRSCKGRAVVAHFGHTLKNQPFETLKKTAYSLIDAGVDGFECYYPLHTRDVQDFLIAVCDRIGLMKTAGSDCHGDFGHSRVGQMNISTSMIDLRGI